MSPIPQAAAAAIDSADAIARGVWILKTRANKRARTIEAEIITRAAARRAAVREPSRVASPRLPRDRRATRASPSRAAALPVPLGMAAHAVQPIRLARQLPEQRDVAVP